MDQNMSMLDRLKRSGVLLDGWKRCLRHAVQMEKKHPCWIDEKKRYIHAVQMKKIHPCWIDEKKIQPCWIDEKRCPCWIDVLTMLGLTDEKNVLTMLERWQRYFGRSGSVEMMSWRCKLLINLTKHQQILSPWRVEKNEKPLSAPFVLFLHFHSYCQVS